MKTIIWRNLQAKIAVKYLIFSAFNFSSLMLETHMSCGLKYFYESIATRKNENFSIHEAVGYYPFLAAYLIIEDS